MERERLLCSYIRAVVVAPRDTGLSLQAAGAEMIRPPQITSRFLVLIASITATLAGLSNFTSFWGKERARDAIGTGCG